MLKVYGFSCLIPLALPNKTKYSFLNSHEDDPMAPGLYNKYLVFLSVGYTCSVFCCVVCLLGFEWRQHGLLFLIYIWHEEILMEKYCATVVFRSIRQKAFPYFMSHDYYSLIFNSVCWYCFSPLVALIRLSMQYCAWEWLFIEEAIIAKLTQVTNRLIIWCCAIYVQIVIVTWVYRLAVWLFSPDMIADQWVW